MPAVSDFTDALETLFASLRAQATDQLETRDAALIGALDPHLGDVLSLLDDLETDLLAAVDGLVIGPDEDFDEVLAATLAAANLPFLTVASTGDHVSLGLTSLSDADLGEIAGILPQGIGFSFDSLFDLVASLDLDLSLEFDPETGELAFVGGTNAAEFGVGATLNLPDSVDGQFGILGVSMTQGAGPNGADVLVSVNFPDGTLQDVAPVAALSFEGGLSLEVEADAGSEFLPSISGTFEATYETGDDPEQIGQLAQVGLQDIAIGLDVFERLFGEIFDGIDNVTSTFPLGPLVKLFNAPLPLFQQLQSLLPSLDSVGNDGRVTLVDLLSLFGQSGNFEFINALVQMIDAVDAIAELAQGNLSVGSIDLSDEALAALNDGQPGVGLSNLFDIDVDPDVQDAFDALPGAIAALDAFGLRIPLLSDEAPGLIGQMVFSEFLRPDADTPPPPVPLVELILPELRLPRDQASFEFTFPVGPFGFVLEGGFDARFQVGLGYSTQGLSAPNALGGFLDGLYLTTELQEDGDRAPMVSLTADIGAGFGISVPGLRITIDGGFEGQVDLFLNDDADGYADGLAHVGDLLPCLFDPIQGEITAGVGMTFRVGIGPLGWSTTVKFAEIIVANFSLGCAGPNGQDAPILSGIGLAEREGTTLHLNVGGRAENRDLPDGLGDGVIDEIFSVTRMEPPEDGEDGSDNDPPYDPTALQVNAFGVGELHSQDGVAVIRAEGQSGRDVLTIAEGIDIDAVFFGGGDNDVLITQGGNDTARGGGGDDLISTGAGDDNIQGNAGADTIRANAGADRIDGGSEVDQVDYSSSPEAVFLTRIGSSVFGAGGWAEGDELTNVEYLVGTAHADLLTGDESSPNTLDGGGSGDIVIGGSGMDLLIGGAGADLLDGRGDGGDVASYVTSTGGVSVNLDTGQASRADAEGDQVLNIEGLHGSMHDDVFTGTQGANFIDGFAGDDLITTMGGADTALGGGGDDTIRSQGSGADLDGGGSLAQRFDRDLLSYAAATGPIVARLAPALFDDGFDNDDLIQGQLYSLEGSARSLTISSFEDLEGSDHNDRLGGDIGDNLIIAGDGNDTVDAEAGNDTVSGGDGADSLDGNLGRDLLDYSGSSAAVDVDLAAGTGSGGHAQDDTVSGFEDLLGSGFADTLEGDAQDNVIDPGLTAFGLTDEVNGRGGRDTLRLDYSMLDTAIGFAGGIGFGGTDQGAFEFAAGGPAQAVTFNNIQRFDIRGSIAGDLIVTGNDDDTIVGGGGNDIIGAGLGQDIVNAGDGDDLVFAQIGDRDTEFGVVGGGDFFVLNGGAGIDGLSVDLTEAPEALTLMLPEPFAESDTQLLGFSTGALITGFEFIGDIGGTAFSDAIGQEGRFNNTFLGAGGDDSLAPGLGFDTVDGGETPLDPDLPTDADFLFLDYSVGTADTGVIMTSTAGGGLNAARFDEVQSGDTTTFLPVDTLVAQNIEYAHVIGTAQGDLIGGVNDSFYDERGDTLEGRDGDDILISFNGPDILLGGAGQDALAAGSGDDSLQGGLAGRDDGQDSYTGGAGADLFILGDRTGSHYGELEDGALSRDMAVIEDFNARRDTIQLAGRSEDYTTQTVGADTLIRRGADNVTIARIEGTTGLDLDSDVFQYVRVISGGGGGIGSLGLQVAQEGADRFAGTDAFGANAGADVSDQAVGALQDLSVDLPRQTASRAVDALSGDLDGGRVAAFEVTQGLNLGDMDQLLSQSLLAQGVVFTVGDATLERVGDARAFGTFENAPGLDEGIVISNGQATDLPGQNLEDGGLVSHLFGGMTVDLDFEQIGTLDAGENQMTFYRANLADVPFEIASLILTDDNDGTGGAPGPFSGADIAGIALTDLDFDDITALTGGSADALDDPSVLPRLDLFDFTPNGTFFSPGDQRLVDQAPSGPGGSLGVGAGDFDYPEDGVVAAPDLIGALGGYVNNAVATLGQFDYFVGPGNAGNDLGFLSLGDGGALGFNLTQTLAADEPVWLIVAEAGGSEAFEGTFTASSQPLPPPGDLSTDFGVEGPQDDSVSLTFDFNVSLPDDAPYYVHLVDLVLMSEELREFSGTELQDSLSITLNGEAIGNLSDGAELALERLSQGPVGPYHPDLVLNLAEDANGSPDETRADAYTVAIPIAGYLVDGVNSLQVTVSDNRDGLLDTAVLLAAPDVSGPVAPPASEAPSLAQFTTPEDSPLAGDLSDGAPAGLDYALIPGGGTANGALVLNADGSFAYTPDDDYFGNELFYYQTTDGSGDTQIAAAQISVTPVNDPLIAEDDSFDVVQGQDLTGSVFADNGNGPDRDVDGDPFGVTLLNGSSSAIDTQHILPSGAMVSLTADGDFFYQDNGAFGVLLQGETAQDAFMYTIENAAGEISMAQMVVRLFSFFPDVNLVSTAQADFLVGTNEDDTIAGRAGADTILGLGGDDHLMGDRSSDTLNGGQGDDLLDGGENSDAVSYVDAPGSVRVYLNSGAGRGADGRDDLVSIENVIGSGFADRIVGAPGLANILHGGPGDDRIDTRGGAGLAAGEDGDDTLRGGADGETLLGGEGADLIVGSGGDDLAEGGPGDDTVRGNRGEDSLNGGVGHDRIDGGGDADTLEGDDGEDRIFGGPGDDAIDGGAERDNLYGDRGDDTIVGGPGDDRLEGGQGVDRFVFAPGDGDDRIRQWEDGIDQLDLVAHGFADFAAVLAIANPIGSGLRLEFASGDSVLLEGVPATQFDAGDVILT